jgi:hypothetical protein
VVLAQIWSFQPGSHAVHGWNELTSLVEELKAGGHLAEAVPDILAVFEKYPDKWPVFSLWSIVHDLDWVPEAVSPAIVPALRRRPTAFAAMVALRLIARGMGEPHGVSLAKLLEEISAGTDLLPATRARLSRCLANVREALASRLENQENQGTIQANQEKILANQDRILTK